MKNKVSLLGFDIYSKSKKECLEDILKRDRVHIISGNPEVLFTASNNEVLKNECLSEEAIIIPDGIGVKIAAKLKGMNIYEKIAGIELMMDIVNESAKLNYPIFLLGSTKEVVESCSQKLKEMNGNIIIGGTADGFFEENEVDELIDKITKCNAKVLFVAMGCPKQEEFIIKYRDKMNCKVLMGVGGSFDVISGKNKRAPRWMINLGLEWLFRVVREPKRIVRLLVIPKFTIKALVYKE